MNSIILEKKSKKEPLGLADFNRVNILADSMTNKSNVLDLLIYWGKTKDSAGNSLLNLLTKEFESELNLFSEPSFSLLDIITEFRKEKGTSKFNPKQRLGEIIKIIDK